MILPKAFARKKVYAPMIYAPSCFFTNQVSGFVDRQFICHIQFNKAFTHIPKLCYFLQIT